MPPGGSSDRFCGADFFDEYEPCSLSPEEIQRRRAQQDSLRLFQDTLEQVRQLAEQLQEQFRQATEQTARIREEQKKIRRAIRRQKKLTQKRRKMLVEREVKRRRVAKMFFACRERRQAFPDLAKQYLQSIS
ncbi:uncharacterized protein CELE_W05H7.1 [Caenorhabditis elegans]|uniref:Uncharacterized protein n=1 Tax=Caenorhabditis elegans TaxID=6239 RepID=O02176_CAEEL|nr:Uncharacterized protein CELE_W05H7.1 [Caenorhabditis elegans]CCD68291.1 Uncharacterized protein CELE_W05H7.1 [Caenorhabditis elegans]|eukprot:NP_508275.1 Uncharacterized protein CELE_W05H7.1 [Caenorhabditis elegans]